MHTSIKPQRHSYATVALGGTLLIACMALFWMVWTSLRQGRQRYEEQARINSRNLAQVLERNLSGEIRAIDLALFSVKQALTRELQVGAIRPSRLDACIQETFALNPCLDSLRTANAAGEIEHGIGVPPGSRISIRDRDYFQVLKRDPSAGLIISKPALGRISGKQVVMLARRIEAPDGTFQGIVYGVITLAEFTRGLSMVNPGPKGIVALRDGELGLIALYPYVPGSSDYIGDRRVSPLSASLKNSGKNTATYMTRTAMDQVERTFSCFQVGNYPLYVFVGLAPDDYLAQWRREAHKTWALFGVFCLSTFCLGALLHRAWKRNEERIQELRLALEEVNTLQEFLPICMYCKKIRDDHNYWSQIEQYITTHTGSRFSHGVCPDCLPRMMEDLRQKS